MSIPFSQVKPQSLRLKVLPRYPARITTGAGLVVTQSGAEANLTLDFTDLERDDIASPIGLYVGTWDATEKIFKLVKADALKGDPGTPGDQTLASQAQAEAGAENVAYMSALRTKQAITSSPAFSPLSGGNAQSVVQVIRDLPANVQWYGATGNGSTDDTAAINAALTANRAVFIPPGNYKLTAPLIGQPDARVEGANWRLTRLQRNGVWNGSTLRLGTTDGVTPAGCPTVKNILFEQLHPGFVHNTSTTMVDRLTNGQAHIQVNGSTKARFESLWFQHAVYGIQLYGCVAPVLSDIHSFGAYDLANASVSEQVAVIHLASRPAVAGQAFCTEVRIEKSYIGGGGPSADRSRTIGSLTYTGRNDIGALYGVLVEAVEGLDVQSTYMGGTNQANISFQPSNISTMVSVNGCFFDESENNNIEFAGTDSLYPTTSVSIVGNKFNGQLQTRNCILASNNSGANTAFGVTIQGNTMANVCETPLKLLGMRAATIAANTIGAYNARGGGTSDAAISSGAYVGQVSREIHFEGGLFGGGINDWSASNNCKWGVYSESAAYATASNVRAILGLAGGAVSNITQTYPT